MDVCVNRGGMEEEWKRICESSVGVYVLLSMRIGECVFAGAFMCMHARVYSYQCFLCMQECEEIYTVNVCACVCMRARVRVCMCVCMRRRMCMHVCVCVCVCKCVCLCVLMCVRFGVGVC